MLRSKNLVEIVHFSTVESTLSGVHLFQLRLFVVCVMDNFNLIIAIDLDFASRVPVFEMQHWSYSHRYFDPSSASVAFALIPPRTLPSFVVG